jgi:PBSX family phage terminase large subunit
MAGSPLKKARREAANDLQWTREKRLLVEEAVKRKRARDSVRNKLKELCAGLENSLHPFQKTFLESPKKKKLARCSRRAGKTHLAAVGLISAAINNDNLLVPYITLSIKNARRIVWTTLREIERTWAFGMEFLENSLTVRFPNGSQIIMGGCEDASGIEKFRGPKYALCVIDEAQSIKSSILAILINDILEPACLDLNGSIWMFGTPGAGASGFFYDANCLEMKQKAWESHAWTLLDNPHLPGAQAWLDRKIIENSWSVTDATYRREYCGEWVRDENSLVYQFNKIRNLCEELPDVDFHYALGVDLGFIDSTAFVVVGWSDSAPETYVLEVSKFTHLTSDDIGKKIKWLDGEYEFERIVADTGGLGKMVVEEMSKRFSLNILPAQKRAKHDHIELLNSDFKKGKLQIYDTEENQLLIDELELLEWDLNERTKGRFIERSDCENHACDAMLYVWRESLAFLHQSETFQPLLGSDEWYKAEEAKMEAAAEAKVVGDVGNWWEEHGPDPVYDEILN